MMVDATELGRKPWKQKLRHSTTGTPKPNLFNAAITVREAPQFRGRIAYDEFAMRTVVLAKLPWSEDDERGADNPRFWDESDDLNLTQWIQGEDIAIKLSVAQQAVEAVARENRFHPVRAYFDGIEWDGFPRLSGLFSSYFGAERSDYVEAVSRCFMISAVARIFDPGCKADSLPILEGPQGTRKSSGLRSIAGPKWFTDDVADIGSKDAAMQIRGVLVAEFAELDQMTRAEASRAKAWMSRQVDRFRPPYGVRLVEAPRECVFAGTTNRDDYLKDETGNRRYWPIKCGTVHLEAIERDRDQLWAEAVAAYREREQWWLSDSKLVENAKAEQDARETGDPWEKIVDDYLEHRASATVPEILDVIMPERKDRWGQREQNRVVKILKRRDWSRKQQRVPGSSKRQWLYTRPDSHPLDQDEALADPA